MVKSKNISDKEMMRTFNCGVGFCLMCPKKNISKIKKYFQRIICLMKSALFQKNKNKVNLIKSFKW